MSSIAVSKQVSFYMIMVVLFIQVTEGANLVEFFDPAGTPCSTKLFQLDDLPGRCDSTCIDGARCSAGIKSDTFFKYCRA